MRQLADNGTGSVPAASAATTRNLRPRQASGAPGPPAGGRATRSSAALPKTTSTNENPAVPQPPPPSTPKSHKRSGPSSGNASRPKRTRRSPHKPGFYGEDSDSDSGDEVENPHISPSPDVEQKASIHQQRRAPKAPTPKKPTTPARATKSPCKLVSKPSPAPEKGKAVVRNGIIPDWASLPYLILAQIFLYAAAPLTETQHTRWLTAASGVCRAFAEPALSALYQTPPLLSRPMAHGLLELLSMDPSSTAFNYRVKVKELWIDVDQIASKTFKGRPLDLEALVSYLPRLKVIQFFHQKDDPPYRSLDGSLRWHYPSGLFDALNGAQVSAEGAQVAEHARLVEWQWNRRLMGPTLDLAAVEALHRTPAFSSLIKTSFVNYQVPSLHAKATDDVDELAAKDEAFIQGMANAINALPHLRHLAIESSTAANDQLLPLLPKCLETLELINCWDINGDDFAHYLLLSGHQLKRLILHHNQSLSLSFLPVLGAACPNLQVFSMDFKTFNHHEFYHDADPSYDDLLTPDQVPAWPEALETLQLLNMKKWTADAAETLFQSLTDSASKLLKLRRLELKAMLSIPILERSRLRNKWERKLRHIFLRENQDPMPVFSLREPAQQPSIEEVKRASKRPAKVTSALAAENPSRRSGRLSIKRSNPPSRASSSGAGRGLRHALARPSYAEPDTDEDEDEDEHDEAEGGQAVGGSSPDSQPESPASSAGTAETAFRQGMCEKVEIQLDNQKSVETTLTMDDFLDSENDDLSDDDWVGQDEDEDTGYAW
ncbi:uncharacterized protein B0H64DRAFT_403954 [Chaetomium fimeti]|uniref:Uncharacterized protein n=1 Tax=Chaetomium fimeti TaxID=1854472 RepID=A0AAE0LQ93_9PEZI|nr:hypothetical protein B0H64DRAFT_403954 [Chaetomium fimeti]